ncbi:hypothetical protein B0H63DRAFT_446920 [Podospora didyma]|uniref:Uncharacterized protein n=1 Tax=Podospora didyma TaxID=330526 RepID=A0AAE0P054_9PEZI|nr:hypothetical protein B0H63DRAFT_446920 [Podospora didyma]
MEMRSATRSREGNDDKIKRLLEENTDLMLMQASYRDVIQDKAREVEDLKQKLEEREKQLASYTQRSAPGAACSDKIIQPQEFEKMEKTYAERIQKLMAENSKLEAENRKLGVENSKLRDKAGQLKQQLQVATSEFTQELEKLQHKDTFKTPMISDSDVQSKWKTVGFLVRQFVQKYLRQTFTPQYLQDLNDVDVENVLQIIRNKHDFATLAVSFHDWRIRQADLILRVGGDKEEKLMLWARDVFSIFRLSKARFQIFLTRIKPPQHPPLVGFIFDVETMERKQLLPDIQQGTDSNDNPMTIDLVIAPSVIKAGNADSMNCDVERILVKLDVACNVTRFIQSMMIKNESEDDLDYRATPTQATEQVPRTGHTVDGMKNEEEYQGLDDVDMIGTNKAAWEPSVSKPAKVEDN